MSARGKLAVRSAWFVTAALLGTGCDVGTKVWAERTLTQMPGHTMRLVEPWLDLTLQYNPGTAFSFITDLGVARVVLGVLSFLVVGLLLAFAVRGDRLQALALGVIAGGALGNAYDRVFRVGVIDFIQVNYPWGGSWPTFNVADALVAVGAALLILDAWRGQRSKPPEDVASPPGAPEAPA